jgi:translation initiation factor IF-3
MEQVTVKGAVVRVLDTKISGESNYKTRSVHVKTDEQWPQVLDIQFTQGNVELLNNLTAGQKLKITLNLKGKEFTNATGELKVFNSLQGWKIEKLS